VFDKQLNLLDVASISTEGVIAYYPQRLILTAAANFYSFILLSHISLSKGLIFYQLTETDSTMKGVFEIANCSNAGTCYKGNYYVSCFTGVFQDFACVSSCDSGYYLKGSLCLRIFII
jgi:hypothetical protein